MTLALILTAMLTISITALVLLPPSSSEVNGLTNVNNTYFSINIPDNWTYTEGLSSVGLTPNEFGVILLNQTKVLTEKMEKEGAYSSFSRDWNYPIKNAAGLDLYVKYEIDKQDGMKVVTQENVTIDNEPAVKIVADGIKSFNNTKFVEYMVMHNKEPYNIAYMANVKDYDKHLPEFEQIVKSFKFKKEPFESE
jgi:PsbP-like protein